MGWLSFQALVWRGSLKSKNLSGHVRSFPKGWQADDYGEGGWLLTGLGSGREDKWEGGGLGLWEELLFVLWKEQMR